MIGKFRKLSTLDFLVIKHLSATSIFNTIQNPVVSGTPSMYEIPFSLSLTFCCSASLPHIFNLPYSLTVCSFLPSFLATFYPLHSVGAVTLIR